MDLANYIKINNLSNCRLCGPDFFVSSGKVALTYHHILIISDEDLRILYKAIAGIRLLDSVVDRRYASSGTTGFTIAMCMKNFRIYELTVPKLNDARLLLESLECLKNIDDPLLLYPFSYNPSFPNPKSNRVAGVDDRVDLLEALTTNAWRVCTVNKNFAVCPTYPENVIVPASVTDATIVESSSFHRMGRFCIMLYYHRPRKTALLVTSEPVNGQNQPVSSPASSLASSALSALSLATTSIRGGAFHSPSSSTTSMVSLSSSLSNISLPNVAAPSRADEQLLAAILLPDCRGAILDVRDQIPGKKNAASGMGEFEQSYPRWRKINKHMVPLARLTKVFRKFIEMCMAPTRNPRANISAFGVLASGTLSDSFSAALTSSARSDLGELNLRGRDHESNLSDRALDYPGTGNTGAYKTRPLSAWLTIVRDTLAVAVAGATALDARDAFAQQQYQQAQCLVSQRYKSQADRSTVSDEPKLQGSSVIVQSCQGTDRALVIAGLIQVILNPGSRTFSGFHSLIDQTWLRAGHPFASRYRDSVLGSRATSDEAPVFILFLDCVWQLYRQYPTAFEFTDGLLALLGEHVYYSPFGTFLGNNMKEREELQIFTKTVSVWSYLEQPDIRARYTNPLYSGAPSDRENYACWPCLAPQAIDVWSEFYQGQLFLDPTALWEKPRQAVRLITEKFYSQTEHVAHLRSILEQLEKEAVASGLL